MAKRKDMIETVGEWYKSAPRLSANVRDPLVSLFPLLVFVIGIMELVGNGAYSFGIFSTISGGMFIAASVLLYKRQQTGWLLTVWASLVGLLPMLLSFHIKGLLQAVILTAILYYLLFEVRSYYK